MKLLRNRFVLFIICAGLAGVIAFVVIPRLNEQRAETATVYRASVPIAKGELIDASRIIEVEAGALGLPEGYMTDREAIIGKTAQTQISKGDLFFPDKLGDHIVDKTLDNIMAENKRLCTISVQSMAAGLSGHLERGDIVSVALFIPKEERYDRDGNLEITPAEARLIPELRGLTVYDIENARTVSTEDEKKRQAQEDSTAGLAIDIVPKTVTLAVTEAQAVKLIEAEYSGKLHIIFERRDTGNG